MKLWHLFFNREVTHEAFKPNPDERECNAAEAPSVAPVRLADGDQAELDSASHEKGQARSSARVFLIRSPRVPLYPMALYFKSRGYRLKQDGRGFIEVTR